MGAVIRLFAVLWAVSLLVAVGCDDDDNSEAACGEPAPGPFTPELVTDALGSGKAEDLAFDGRGRFVTVAETGLVQVAPDGTITPVPVASELPMGGGLRYLPDGRLLFALFTGGKVIEISPDGAIRDFVADLNGPNAIYCDFDGNAWITESFGNRIIRADGTGKVDVIASGGMAEAPNGLVYDSGRNALFFVAGLGQDDMRVGRIDFGSDGAPSEPVSVYTLAGAGGDGIALDACGNLYIVENAEQGSGIKRLTLDAAGDLVKAERIVEFEVWITNLQWASGPGFDANDLYVVGFDGFSYRIPVGVAGMPVPIPALPAAN